MAYAPLGYSALIARFKLRVPPLHSISELADKTGVLSTHTGADGSVKTVYPRNRYRGDDTTLDHLTFALRKEPLNLTVLAALFEHQEAVEEVRQWLAASPGSRYARLSGFYAKWLAGAQFDYKLPAGTARVAALDEADYVTGDSQLDAQFGILNNHLGPAAFCPLVRRTERLQAFIGADLPGKIAAAINRLEPEVLARAVDYLYLAETRSTYSIEKELPDNQRVARFRRLLEFAGAAVPLDEAQFCEWQNEIISSIRAEYAYRDRQNWLSRGGRLRNIADYIPPPPQQVEPMMEGLAQVAGLIKTKAAHPLVIAACVAFGFVYIHPFYDGNGRLHRFLIHHLLRQAGVTPEGVVLPVSASMLKNLPVYAGLLKDYSAPRTGLLNYVLDADSDTILIKSPQPYWLYASFDATALCEFVFECVQQCVEEDLALEIRYLKAFDASVARIEGWLDLRQARLTNLIDLVVQNHGELSNRKRAKFTELSDAEIARIEEVVRDEFADYFEATAKAA
ncbi:Fic family protein [Cupriavidus sp. amp6]|uniref:Fic family protein n=1 Tax=Cupriavidus sp. amp6 TaxID=388051 RepID=UPI00040ED890|nr:Fic family protein [Cupriavidus sp. amp6]